MVRQIGLEVRLNSKYQTVKPTKDRVFLRLKADDKTITLKTTCNSKRNEVKSIAGLYRSKSAMNNHLHNYFFD